MGFNGIITKPIDPEDLKVKITRALSLDTSYRYFVTQDGVLLLKLPPNFNPFVANDITLNLRSKVTEGVDSGLGRLLMDMSRMTNADVNLVKLGINVTSLCQELGVRLTMIGSEAVCAECKNYEETKDWQFAGSYEEALSLLTGKSAGAS